MDSYYWSALDLLYGVAWDFGVVLVAFGFLAVLALIGLASHFPVD